MAETAEHTPGGRYRTIKELGRGGMAVVVEAQDRATGEHVALKRFAPKRDASEEARARLRLSFEREYHTLSQLAHPNIIGVHDYSVDHEGPFYTMELLAGGDLHSRAPLPWKEVCGLLVDVCSGLSLIHSRRMVHRDVTPKNVRCTRDGRAKLTDFGAICSFGPQKHIVGTPAFTAPEVLTGQALDARTDLFALGATAYYLLSGRHAFPAHSFAAMRNVWRSQPASLLHLPGEIPEELNELVMSLLQLAPVARPAGAATVLSRLAELAGITVDESVVEQQAYLTTPTLIARDDVMLQVRKQLVRATRGRGGTFDFTAPSGMGRSRIIDACHLEGRILGMAVFRMDAHGSSLAPWSAIQTLTDQLLRELPHVLEHVLAPRASTLVLAWPELVRRGLVDGDQVIPATFEGAQERRAAIQTALRDFFIAVSQHRALLLLADDVHRMDEPSASLVSLLASDSIMYSMAVVATADAEAGAAAPDAMALLKRVSTGLELRPFTLEQTRELLASLFGAAPHLALLANRLHPLSEGSPTALMDLAQHLVDQGLFRCDAGRWLVPTRVSTSDLPRSVSDAISERFAGLPQNAQDLVTALAISGAESLSFEDCQRLFPDASPSELMTTLSLLRQTTMLVEDDGHYSLARPGLASVALDRLDPARGPSLHRRLIEVFLHKDEAAYAVARHALAADEPQQALETFVAFAHRMVPRFQEDRGTLFEHLRQLPDDWPTILSNVLDLAASGGCSLPEQMQLRLLFATTAAYTTRSAEPHLSLIMQRYARDCGLTDYAQLDPSIPASERMGLALQAAEERWKGSPEHERDLPPLEALRRLAHCLTLGVVHASNTQDYEYMDKAPDLGPYASLSPAISVLQEVVRAAREATRGNTASAITSWIQLLDRLENDALEGLDPRTREQIKLVILATTGGLGAISGAEVGNFAERLADDATFALHAWRIRTVQAVVNCDHARAQHFREQAELVRIQNATPTMFEGTSISAELVLVAAIGDETRLDHALATIDAMAREAPGWRSFSLYGRGFQHLRRGDARGALSLFDETIAMTSTLGSTLGPMPSVARMTALLELGEYAQVAKEAEALLSPDRFVGALGKDARARLLLALALAKLGKREPALQALEQAADDTELELPAPLHRGFVHEMWARVAITLKDLAMCTEHTLKLAGLWRVETHPVLAERFARLVNEARTQGLRLPPEVSQPGQHRSGMDAEMRSQLAGCTDGEARFARALDWLLDLGQSDTGLLYTMTENGPTLSASAGEAPPPENLDDLVRAYLSAEVADTSEVLMTTDTDTLTQLREYWSAPNGSQFTPLLMSHSTPDGYLITGVAVMCVSDQQSSSKVDLMEASLPLLSELLLEAGAVSAVNAAF